MESSGMNIGLLDIDNHNFPNLALMKIAAWHKSQGDNVEFATMFNSYDIIYRSKIFSWTPHNEYCYNTKKYISGGTGYDYNIVLDNNIDRCFGGYWLYNCEHAYGFLTRGCPNKCSWCIVPQKEGNIRPYADIEDFIGDFNSAILMDNNVLASDHGIKQIEKIIKLGIKVDFNQGLDARLIDDLMARLLARVKWFSPLRLACDTQAMIEPVRKAVELLRWHNCKPIRYFVYVLIKDIDETLDRVKFLKGIEVDPFGQVLRDDKFIPTKRHYELERWINHKAIFKTVKFEYYNP